MTAKIIILLLLLRMFYNWRKRRKADLVLFNDREAERLLMDWLDKNPKPHTYYFETLRAYAENKIRTYEEFLKTHPEIKRDLRYIIWLDSLIDAKEQPENKSRPAISRLLNHPRTPNRSNHLKVIRGGRVNHEKLKT